MFEAGMVFDSDYCDRLVDFDRSRMVLPLREERIQTNLRSSHLLELLLIKVD
jgi:hypothetical protein